MKQILPFVAVLFGTLVLAVALNVGLMYLSPGLFGGGDSPLGAVDSLHAAVPDSANPVGTDSTMTARDSASVLTVTNATTGEVLLDSLAQLRELVAFEMARSRELEERLVREDRAADSLRTKKRKEFAKMIESMSAEDAARILQNLDQGEMQSVLMIVKKKHAGKILSAMDARRAAEIMN